MLSEVQVFFALITPDFWLRFRRDCNSISFARLEVLPFHLWPGMKLVTEPTARHFLNLMYRLFFSPVKLSVSNAGTVLQHHVVSQDRCLLQLLHRLMRLIPQYPEKRVLQSNWRRCVCTAIILTTWLQEHCSEITVVATRSHLTLNFSFC